jgi:DNA-binding transcriptional ArsR family regulator
MPVNYAQVIVESRQELKKAVTHRDSVDRRIAELSSALRALVRFLPDEGQRNEILQELKDAKRKSVSLPDAIIGIMANAKEGMNASQIREQLELSGFDIEEYSQPLGAVMTAAQRLAEDGKLRKEKTEESGVVFYPPPKAPIPPNALRVRLGLDKGNK